MSSLQVALDLSLVLSSLLFFIYIDTKKLFKNDRIINSALIHSIISGVGHNIGLLMYPSLISDYNGNVQKMSVIFWLVPFISFGYSFYDVYIGFKSKRLENIIHGVVFCVGYTCAYKNGIIMAGYLFMQTETSSIFLNLRPLKQKWIDWLFISTFFIYRIALCPYLILMYSLNPENKGINELSWSIVLITLLNIYWFYFIVKKAIRIYSKEKKNSIEDLESISNSTQEKIE
jgi:hypothetical protein